MRQRLPFLSLVLLPLLWTACHGTGGTSVLPADSGQAGPEDTGSDTDPPDTGDSGSPGDTADTGEPSEPDLTTVYALRHAEKESGGDDPGLTEAGRARAEALATAMGEVTLHAIYATDKRRTQETVEPTAQDHGLPVQVAEDPEEGLALTILEEHHEQTVMHCGHSYTLPDFFDALGWEDAPDAIDSDQYGDLWILVWDEEGELTVTLDHFGD